jgi:hypothetical protein
LPSSWPGRVPATPYTATHTAIVPSRAVHAPLRVTITKTTREKQLRQPPQHLLAALFVDTFFFIVAVAAMDSIYHVPRPCRSAIMPLLHVFVSQADPCCLGSTQHVSCIAVTALRDHSLPRARCACSPAASCITRAANAVSLAPIPSSVSIIVGVNQCSINADQS